jgi:hypothetical protein
VRRTEVDPAFASCLVEAQSRFKRASENEGEYPECLYTAAQLQAINATAGSLMAEFNYTVSPACQRVLDAAGAEQEVV